MYTRYCSCDCCFLVFSKKCGHILFEYNDDSGMRLDFDEHFRLGEDLDCLVQLNKSFLDICLGRL